MSVMRAPNNTLVSKVSVRFASTVSHGASGLPARKREP